MGVSNHSPAIHPRAKAGKGGCFFLEEIRGASARRFPNLINDKDGVIAVFNPLRQVSA